MTSKNPKVSVIIPCYNVEKYIERCLDSVCAQTLKDIEIICVDDCSTDDTLSVIKEYAKRDNRINIIKHKNNKGVSAARNAGLKKAIGEYIAFVDPDDYIDDNFLTRLYNTAIVKRVSIVKGGVIITDCNTNIDCVGVANNRVVSNNNEVVSENIMNWTHQFWSAIYETKFLTEHNIKFPEHLRNGEDAVFLSLVVLAKPKIATVDDTYYHYQYQREGSLDAEKLTHQNAQARVNMIRELLRLEQVAKISEETEKIYFERHILNRIHSNLCKYTFEYDKDRKELFQILVELQKNTKYPHCLYNYFTKAQCKAIIDNNYQRFVRKTKLSLPHSRWYLFCVIPAILIVYNANKVYYRLFDVIPVLKIKNHNKYYLFNFFPLLKKKG